MNRDGTPETPIEQWVLDAGLGRAYMLSGRGFEITQAQHEALLSSTLDPQYNSVSKYLLEHVRNETALQWPSESYCSHIGGDDE